MTFNKDQYNFKYYEWSSEKWKKVESIWEFVDISPEYPDYYKVKLNTKYIIYSRLRDVYELYEINEHTRDSDLLPFIKQGRLYVLS